MGQLAIEASVVSPLQELLESTRRPDLRELAPTLEDKKITQDEFMNALSSKINKDQAVGLFTEVQKIFGPELTKEEVVPFWALFVEGQGLPKGIRDLVRGTEWIPVHAERLQGVDGQEIGHVTIKRSIVPKGVIGPGFELNDGGLGAWRLVHFINVDLVLYKNKFGLTDEELAHMIARVDLYAKALTSTKFSHKIEPGKLTPRQQMVYNQLDCSALYYSHVDTPWYAGCDGYDVICMPLATTPNGALVRQYGAIVLDWTTRMRSKGGSPVDLNVLANPKLRTCARDAWGRWILFTKDSHVVIKYYAILDMPEAIGANAGTGDENGAISIGNNVIKNMILSPLEDNIKLGLMFDQAKKAISIRGKAPSFDETINFMQGFYNKDLSLRENLDLLSKAVAVISPFIKQQTPSELRSRSPVVFIGVSNLNAQFGPWDKGLIHVLEGAVFETLQQNGFSVGLPDLQALLDDPKIKVCSLQSCATEIAGALGVEAAVYTTFSEISASNELVFSLNYVRQSSASIILQVTISVPKKDMKNAEQARLVGNQLAHAFVAQYQNKLKPE